MKKHKQWLKYTFICFDCGVIYVFHYQLSSNGWVVTHCNTVDILQWSPGAGIMASSPAKATEASSVTGSTVSRRYWKLFVTSLLLCVDRLICPQNKNKEINLLHTLLNYWNYSVFVILILYFGCSVLFSIDAPKCIHCLYPVYLLYFCFVLILIFYILQIYVV